MLGLLLSVLGSLFSVVNPLGAVPVFLALSADLPKAELGRTIRSTSMYFIAILLVFFIAGTLILNFFGLDLNALRIAGGLIILNSGYALLNNQFEERRGVNEEVTAEANAKSDISFTPLAMPLLAGPGSISLLIGLYANNPEWPSRLVIAGAVIIMGFIVYLVLRFAPYLYRILGVAGLQALSRIIGFIVMAIGIQLIITGILNLVDLYYLQVHK